MHEYMGKSMAASFELDDAGSADTFAKSRTLPESLGQRLRESPGPAHEFMERISLLSDTRVPWRIYGRVCCWTTMGVKTPVRYP